ncbi:ABC transporter permease [Pseudemcibacter aquimaris]|uniref:ABC transporter permease n=1 Tax=Pseudemcibacter aquimaris TaxID=2857064 RepID=UPI002011E59D|nr:ABC transporter permease [Pseudemcibacter aquimaris]MCC3861131.1 ABC transporter permease [Pseudemcibacter aquimaris]WDU59948.1 ABC transporter permease [Pseudemcibacter aquimaris]
MFKSYLTSTIRDILKNKGYSAINIFGLSVALAACLLISLFVEDELGYDIFIPDGENTYRIEVIAKSNTRTDENYAPFMGAYAPLLTERSADVLDSTRYQTNQLAVSVGDRFFYEDITFADENFIEFMGLDAPENLLTDQLSIVITESVADKYFPDGNAVGNVMTVAGQVDYRVAHVMEDFPNKSHMAITMIAPYNRDFMDIEREFMSMNNMTYVRLRDGVNPEILTPLLHQLIDENVPPFNDVAASTMREPIYVGVRDVYLKSPAGVVGKAGGDINVVIGFISVAVLLVVIATVNYINLATARAMKRAREVGIRKVMGASKKQLILQFLGESIFITMLAALVSIAFVEMALPFFNEALMRDIGFDFIGNPMNILMLLFGALIIGIIAGTYPAFYLSSFNPARVLKTNQTRSASVFLRQFLVFLQFSIAIGLIAGTTVVVRQTLYATNMDPGYEKEGVMLIRNLRSNGLLDQVELLDQQLETVQGIEEVTASQFVPTDPWDSTSSMNIVGNPEDPFTMSRLAHQADFFDLYKLNLRAGRSLDETRESDKLLSIPDEEGVIVNANAVINETAMRQIGFSNPEQILNTRLRWGVGNNRSVHFTVVGVIEDFHLRSIHNAVRPMLYFNSPAFFRTLSLRYATNDFPGMIAELERKWADLAPGIPLGYQLLDDQVDQFYASEQRQMKVFVSFAIVAIIISSVGLLGLTAFTAEKRTREISIRKVLGARTIDILALMVGQFSKPVLLANLVALPLAWWLMQNWLSGFVYRIDLSITWFITAGVAAMVIAWVTVISYSMKAAKTNPAIALRYE